jgi:ribonuclease HI
MMSDFPEFEDINTKVSLYADDTAIWRSGRNIKYNNRKLQEHLDTIVKWCRKWGFRINPKKTIYILFTNKRIPKDITIVINKKSISPSNSAKFLGITFDKRLTWKKHFTNIIHSCMPKINLLRNLTGHHWGARKTTLLTIYRTIIRSRLEYGSSLFYSASQHQLKRLDRIQTRCLRICCGALLSTPTSSLQQECGEMPLSLRRQQQLLRHFTRIRTDASNPANQCLNKDWRSEWTEYKQNDIPILKRIEESGDLSKYNTQSKCIPDSPPWTHIPAETDADLANTISRKTDDLTYIKQATLQHMDEYAEGIHIYTDGSKLSTGETAYGVYIQEINEGKGARLPNHCTVYTAEISAILAALEWIKEERTQYTDSRKFVIYSDSLSSLQAINSSNVFYTTNTITKIHTIYSDLYKERLQVDIVWIPSHIGIKGNEQADKMAKHATSFPESDNEHVPPDRQTVYRWIERSMIKEWQKQYDKIQDKTWYKQLEPNVNKKVKFTATTRREEVTITRIRFEHCRTRDRQFKMKHSESNRCTACPTEVETITHYLTCPNNNIINTGRVTDPHQIRDNILNILSDKQQSHHLYDSIVKLERRI